MNVARTARPLVLVALVIVVATGWSVASPPAQTVPVQQSGEPALGFSRADLPTMDPSTRAILNKPAACGMFEEEERLAALPPRSSLAQLALNLLGGGSGGASSQSSGYWTLDSYDSLIAEARVMPDGWRIAREDKYGGSLAITAHRIDGSETLVVTVYECVEKRYVSTYHG